MDEIFKFGLFKPGRIPVLHCQIHDSGNFCYFSKKYLSITLIMSNKKTLDNSRIIEKKNTLEEFAITISSETVTKKAVAS